MPRPDFNQNCSLRRGSIYPPPPNRARSPDLSDPSHQSPKKKKKKRIVYHQNINVLWECGPPFSRCTLVTWRTFHMLYSQSPVMQLISTGPHYNAENVCTPPLRVIHVLWMSRSITKDWAVRYVVHIYSYSVIHSITGKKLFRYMLVFSIFGIYCCLFCLSVLLIYCFHGLCM